MKSLVLAVVFLAWFVAPANADFDTGKAAYDRGDYATALRELRPLAEQGNAEAQLNLGVMYAMGRGVPQDYTEALRWYRLAVKQGKAEAPSFMGVQYEKGQGVPPDYVLAYIFVAAQKEFRVVPDSYLEGLPSRLRSMLGRPRMGSLQKELPTGWILVAGEWKP